jgi:hypothetical protein
MEVNVKLRAPAALSEIDPYYHRIGWLGRSQSVSLGIAGQSYCRPSILKVIIIIIIIE